MSDASSDTRSDLLDAAEALILDRGLTGATIDAIVDRSGLSKGAFFHHFSSKAELGRILLDRHRERERRQLEEAFRRAEQVSEDSLIRVLVALTLLEDELRGSSGNAEEGATGAQGSLLGSAASQPEAFGEEALRTARESVEERRSFLVTHLEEAARSHPISGGADPEELADTLMALLEGSHLLANLDPGTEGSRLAARRLADFRRHLELLFGVSSG